MSIQRHNVNSAFIHCCFNAMYLLSLSFPSISAVNTTRKDVHTETSMLPALGTALSQVTLYFVETNKYYAKFLFIR